ncbi:MAG: hypothetical protein UZ12_BCD005002166 [Bacteroidetes bacterium OLB12]|nr:MAG: hypothetical protein UZ12_BCD005002166 [Bacteroidetes bacterium OLB12]
MRLAKSIAAVGLIVWFSNVHAQQMLGQRSEVGFGIGTFNYTGDLVRTYNFCFFKTGSNHLLPIEHQLRN